MTAVPGPEGAGLLTGISPLPLPILPFSMVRHVRAMPRSVCLQGMHIHCSSLARSSGHGQRQFKGLSLLSLHQTEAPETHTAFQTNLRSQTEAVSSSQHPAQNAHIVLDKPGCYLSSLLSLPSNFVIYKIHILSSIIPFSVDHNLTEGSLLNC